MEAWAAFLQAQTCTDVVGKQAPAKRAAGAVVHDAAREMAAMGVKLGLKANKDARNLLGAVFRTFKLPVTGLAYKAMKTTTDNFETEVKGKKGHGIIPDGHRFGAAAAALSQYMDASSQKVIHDFMARLPPDSLDLNRTVKVCLLERMHNAEYKRLYIQLAPGYDNVMVFMTKALEADGAQEQLGRAPKGDLERKGQELLEKHGFSQPREKDDSDL